MILPGSYANGFAPRDGMPLYPELWRGCVGAWNPGLGVTGLILRDWSGLAKNAALTNITAASGWVAGRFGYGVRFTGTTGECLTVPAISLSGEMSVSGVINLRSIPSGAGAVLFSHGPTTGDSYAWYYDGSTAYFRTPGGFVGTAAALSTGMQTWQLTRDSANVVTWYVNGRAVGSATRPGTWTLSGIGNVSGGTGGFAMTADVMASAVWQRCLSASEMLTIAVRPSIMFDIAPRRRSRVSVLTSLRYNIFTGNVGSLEVIGAS